MKNKIRWHKGLTVTALIDFGDTEESIILEYAGTNRFNSSIIKGIYFNESLFPFAYEGLVLYLYMGSNIIIERECEIIKILKGTD